jgi:hypothetical protein
MSTYSIYIMQLYDSIYNLLLVVWVLTVSYLFVAYMNHALLIASIPQAYGIFILNLRYSNLEFSPMETDYYKKRNKLLITKKRLEKRRSVSLIYLLSVFFRT